MIVDVQISKSSTAVRIMAGRENMKLRFVIQFGVQNFFVPIAHPVETELKDSIDLVSVNDRINVCAEIFCTLVPINHEAFAIVENHLLFPFY